MNYPDRRLRKRASPVSKITPEIGSLADDLLKTMYDAPGIGLAGPQIGVMLRIFVMDCAAKDEEGDPQVLINPELVWESDDVTKQEEGCLSLPKQFAEVTRPSSVVVKFRDLAGEEQEREFSGIHARCVQHELDHLDGKLFIDHLSLVKRQIIKRKLAKELREAVAR